jgi:hypothetical protein
VFVSADVVFLAAQEAKHLIAGLEGRAHLREIRPALAGYGAAVRVDGALVSAIPVLDPIEAYRGAPQDAAVEQPAEALCGVVAGLPRQLRAPAVGIFRRSAPRARIVAAGLGKRKERSDDEAEDSGGRHGR